MTLIQKIFAGASTAVFASSAGSVISYSLTTTKDKEIKKPEKTPSRTTSPIRYSEFLNWPGSGSGSGSPSNLDI